MTTPNYKSLAAKLRAALKRRGVSPPKYVKSKMVRWGYYTADGIKVREGWSLLGPHIQTDVILSEYAHGAARITRMAALEAKLVEAAAEVGLEKGPQGWIAKGGTP